MTMSIDKVNYSTDTCGMEIQKELEPLKVDRSKLITQTKYAELIKISKQRVNQMIKDGKIKTVKIEGAVLVLMD